MAASTDRSKWHPFFTALFDHAAAKPGAVLTHPWGHSVFGVGGKNFVFLGDPDKPGMTVKPYPGSREALLAEKKAEVAQYVGRFGWVAVHVENKQKLALALALIDESYEHLIPPRARAAAAKKAAAANKTKATPKKRAAKAKSPRGSKKPRKP